MGRFITIVIFAALFFVIGTSSHVYAFFVENSHADVAATSKTTIHPSTKTKPLKTPLNASEKEPTEVEPVKVTNPLPLKPKDQDIHVAISNEDIVWNRLRAEGFSREQTAGIMGNLQQEHNFQTDGDGLAQWTLGRKQNLLARPNNRDINVQLDFLMEELNGDYATVKQKILASGLDNSVLAFQDGFERCGVCMQENRMAYARQILGRH